MISSLTIESKTSRDLCHTNKYHYNLNEAENMETKNIKIICK